MTSLKTNRKPIIVIALLASSCVVLVLVLLLTREQLLATRAGKDVAVRAASLVRQENETLRANIRSAATTSAAAETPDPVGIDDSELQPSQTTLNTEVAETKNGTVVIRHSCIGTLHVTNIENRVYCIGENTLSVSRDGGAAKIMQTMRSSSFDDAPILMKSAYLSTANTVLISYLPQFCLMEPCFGSAVEHATFAVEAGALTSRPINNFPDNDWVVALHWDVGQARAVVELSTCGEGGCTRPKPLELYDLRTDTIKELITIEDASGAIPSKPDEIFNPEKYPHWTSISWTGKDEVTAIVTDPDGKQTEYKAVVK